MDRANEGPIPSPHLQGRNLPLTNVSLQATLQIQSMNQKKGGENMARRATVREAALNTLFESRKPLTAKEMGVSAVVAGNLREAGYTEHVSDKHLPQRGRPQFLYKLSTDTRNEVRKARRRNSAKVTA